MEHSDSFVLEKEKKDIPSTYLLDEPLQGKMDSSGKLLHVYTYKHDVVQEIENLKGSMLADIFCTGKEKKNIDIEKIIDKGLPHSLEVETNKGLLEIHIVPFSKNQATFVLRIKEGKISGGFRKLILRLNQSQGLSTSNYVLVALKSIHGLLPSQGLVLYKVNKDLGDFILPKMSQFPKNDDFPEIIRVEKKSVLQEYLLEPLPLLSVRELTVCFLKGLEQEEDLWIFPVFSQGELYAILVFRVNQRNECLFAYEKQIIALADKLGDHLTIHNLRLQNKEQARKHKKKQQKSLHFLYQAAIQILEQPLGGEIPDFVTEKIRQIITSGTVLIYSHDKQENKSRIVRIKHLTETKNSLNEIFNNINIFKKIEYHEDLLHKLKKGSVFQVVKEDYKEIFGGFSSGKREWVEKELDKKCIKAMGLKYRDALYSSVVFIVDSPELLPNDMFLRILSYFVTIGYQTNKIQAELLTAQQKAKESDTLKQSFLSNISHELRTPLHAIYGFIQLLFSNECDENRKKSYKKIILQNTNILLKQINDLLDLSQIEAGNFRLNYAKSNITDIIERVINKHLRNEKVHKGHVVLQTDVPPECLLLILSTDSKRILQILDNLVSNAFKFTEKGFITIGIRKEKFDFLLFVKDTGIGISGINQLMIFNKFRQADETRSRKYGGLGLGLALSKAIIEQMGGSIDVISVEGKGTEFFFRLPLKK